MAQILVVDDEPTVRATLTAMLTRAGHQVVEAVDGNDALQRFSVGCFDVVIIDIIMPNREGVETIHDLRRQAPHTPIIAVSGGGRSANSVYLDAAMAMGATSTLQKPFRAQQLLDSVVSSLASAP